MKSRICAILLCVCFSALKAENAIEVIYAGQQTQLFGAWVPRSMRTGDTLGEFIHGEGISGGCQEIIDYNVINFDRISSMPGNAGLSAENLAKCKCDTVMTSQGRS